jgi:DNA-binding response OmpR family regulator
MSVSVAQRKILIVEDDADIRSLLNVRLRKHGYETGYAMDGLGAVSIARREQPDLVLLDLGLPAGDGFTVLERMQAIASLAAIPVIVITAREAELSRPKAEAAGASAFVEKPIDFDRLLETIDELLG